jgi:[protein-PII] uridylyltransferase
VELPRDAATRVRECQGYALPLLEADGFDVATVMRVWDGFPQASFLRHRPEQIAWQTAAILRAEGALPLIAVHPLSVRGTTELFVYTPDRDGLFATVTAMLDRLRLSVLEARVLVSPHGMAQDTFLLLDTETQQPATPARADELQQRLARALAQTVPVHPARRNASRQLRHFQMTPRITFHAAGGRTQLALVCTDRPGLLAAVAQAMVEAQVRVHDARIATFGERVEDFFQLTDRHDAPLGEAQQERLKQALLARLGQGS